MKNQQIGVLATLVIVIFGMLIYPPFQVIGPDGMVVNTGYGWLFDPPQLGAIVANVNVPMLLAQWVGVLIIGGLTFVVIPYIPRKFSPVGPSKDEEQIVDQSRPSSDNHVFLSIFLLVVGLVTLFVHFRDELPITESKADAKPYVGKNFGRSGSATLSQGKSKKSEPEIFFQHRQSTRGSETRVLSTNEIARIQDILTQLGYRPGPVDGNVGPLTYKAIKEFETSIGRSFPTGQPTEYLLSVLEARVRDGDRVNGCVYKSVMSDDDYRACGIVPPGTR